MSEIESLKEVVEILRSENGCPWDKAQTHDSLKRECIEEAAEVICGINVLSKTGNPDSLKEELGDLLLQVVMHCQIAKEEGFFDFEDVAAHVKNKMIHRHPHVFPASQKETSSAPSTWEELKKEEKKGREWMDNGLSSAFAEAHKLIDEAARRKNL